MSRKIIPFFADDMSALARALAHELARFEGEGPSVPASGAPAKSSAPSHVQMLNMLARATGYRNFQHLRAQADAHERLDHPAPEPVAAPVDYVRLERIARYFDASGRLVRWPGKHSDRLACLWVIWSRLAARRVYSEAEINRALNVLHLFGDHALLRRDLCDLGLTRRTPDGSEYRRVEQAPPADAAALIRHLGNRLAA